MGERRVAWGVGVRWVVVNALSWAAGGVALIFWSLVEGCSILQVAGFAFVGFVQWLVMRKQISQAGWWGLATAAGWAVGAIVAFQVMLMRSDLEILVLVFAPFVGIAVAGLFVGIAQRLVLRRQVLKASWWISATAVGWVFGWGLSRILVDGLLWEWSLLEPLMQLVERFGGVSVLLALVFGLWGAVQGAVTGPVLVWLLRQSVTTTDGE
jgi:hypothetical protein